MANNVTKEFELYEPMRAWLQQYLENKYKGAKVTTIDSHARTLDTYLEQFGMEDTEETFEIQEDDEEMELK